jgi:hypothetical protein
MRPVPVRLFWALIAANVVLRLYLATLPGYVNDIFSYKQWGFGASFYGLTAVYEKTLADYPPI